MRQCKYTEEQIYEKWSPYSIFPLLVGRWKLTKVEVDNLSKNMESIRWINSMQIYHVDQCLPCSWGDCIKLVAVRRRCIYLYVIRIYTYIRVYIYACIRKYVYTYTHIFTLYTHLYVYAYIYIRIHFYVIRIYVYIYGRRCIYKFP